MDITPLTINTYNLDEITKKVIEHLIVHHPDKNNVWISNQLGISDRTVYRYFKQFGLVRPERHFSDGMELDDKTLEKFKLLLDNFPHMKRRELAKAMRVSERTIYRWLKEAGIEVEEEVPIEA